MKFPHLKHTLRRTCALALCLALSVPTVYAAREHDLLETPYELPGGLTYTNYVSQYSAGRLESYVLELEEDEDVFPILLQSSGTIYGGATLNAAVNRARELGYHVLAGVNTDFFSTATGVPEGIVIEDGVYKSEPSGGDAILITEGEVTLCDAPAVSLTLTNHTTEKALTPHHFNKYRASAGGVYLLNEDFSGVSTRTAEVGWFVRMKLVDYDPEDPTFRLTVNSSLTLEVTELIPAGTATAIGPGEYILTASEASGWGEIFQQFALGDRITLTTVCEDEALSEAQWAGGVGDVLIRDGEITDSSLWDDGYRNSRAPRTALGMRRDGTLVLYAVDGRQKDLSSGLTLADLARAMEELDCRWAVNLDGGGSTTASVLIPGQSGTAIQNSPSDGKPRPGGTYLLLVTQEEASGQPDSLALTENGMTVLTGSRVELPGAVALDEWLNLLPVEVEDLKISSRRGLGDIEDGYYYADDDDGTEKLRLRSRELGVTGEAILHVVDELTELTVSNAATGEVIRELSILRDREVTLTAAGSYYGRLALRDLEGVKVRVDRDLADYDKNTGTVTFHTCGHSDAGITVEAGGLTVTIPVTVLSPHSDVDEDHWAFDAVEYCYENGIVSGISPTEFGVNGNIRRCDFMLMLYGALGRPTPAGACTFTDVTESDYFYTALSWAQHAGLISGVGNGSCAAAASITREQAFTILRKAMALFDKDCPDAPAGALADYADWADLSDYAVTPAATLAAQGVLDGDALRPKDELTRGEMAVLLYNIAECDPIDDYEGLFPAELPQLDPVEPAPSEPEATEPTEPVPSEPEATEPTEPAVTLPVGSLPAGISNAELGLNVRTGPGTDYEAVTRLPNGAAVLILDSADGWHHIRYTREGTVGEGYVSADYVTVAVCPGTVTAQPSLNLRTGPGGDFEAVAKLPFGTAVTVVNGKNGWYQVSCGDQTGWVSAEYVQISAP